MAPLHYSHKKAVHRVKLVISSPTYQWNDQILIALFFNFAEDTISASSHPYPAKRLSIFSMLYTFILYLVHNSYVHNITTIYSCCNNSNISQQSRCLQSSMTVTSIVTASILFQYKFYVLCFGRYVAFAVQIPKS